jgi:hypothetical protein
LLTGTGDGPAAPATDDAAPAADLAGLLTEMRALRGSMTVAVTRMGLIEKQLRRVGGGRQ